MVKNGGWSRRYFLCLPKYHKTAKLSLCQAQLKRMVILGHLKGQQKEAWEPMVCQYLLQVWHSDPLFLFIAGVSFLSFLSTYNYSCVFLTIIQVGKSQKTDKFRNGFHFTATTFPKLLYIFSFSLRSVLKRERLCIIGIHFFQCISQKIR